MRVEQNTNSQQTLGFKGLLESCLLSFNQLLQEISKTDWKSDLKQATNNFSLEQYKLDDLDVPNVKIIFQKLFSKYLKMENEKTRIYWLQNQLKIFVWLCIATSKTFNIPFESYSQTQINKLTQPFLFLNQGLTLYQYKLMISPNYDHEWSLEQETKLSGLVKKYDFNGSWTTISKELFLESNNSFLRTAHACREKWQNHLDTRLIKGQWTLQDDYAIIKNRLLLGKKWSLITKVFNRVRTEHMIKNRYKTILKKYTSRKEVRAVQEVEICKTIEHLIFLQMNSKNSANFDATATSEYENDDSLVLSSKKSVEQILFNNFEVIAESKGPNFQSYFDQERIINEPNFFNQGSDQFVDVFFEKALEQSSFKNLLVDSFDIPDDLRLNEQDFNQSYPILEQPECELLL